jgi:hypothetical protein
MSLTISVARISPRIIRTAPSNQNVDGTLNIRKRFF